MAGSDRSRGGRGGRQGAGRGEPPWSAPYDAARDIPDEPPFAPPSLPPYELDDPYEPYEPYEPYGVDDRDAPDDEPYERQAGGRSARGAALDDAGGGGGRGSRRPLVLGAIALVAVVVAVVAFFATRGEDEPDATFSLGSAAANAAQVDRVAYDVSVRQSGRIVTAARGVIETASGSQQITVSPGLVVADEVQHPDIVVDAVDQAVYLESAAFERLGIQFDRPWVRVDLEQLGEGVTLDPAALVERYGGDPLAVMEAIGRTRAQDLGPDTIDEEPVQHFRLEMTVDELLDANPALAGLLRIPTGDEADDPADDPAGDPAGDQAEDTAGAADEADPDVTSDRDGTRAPAAPDATTARADEDDTVTIDVFVTEDNAVRRLVLATTVPGAAVGTITFDEYDGREAVDVPDEDEVVELADAFGP